MKKLNEEHTEGFYGAWNEEIDDEGREEDYPAPSAVRRYHLRFHLLSGRRHVLCCCNAAPVRFTAKYSRDE
jgi:hypothetical protein